MEKIVEHLKRENDLLRAMRPAKRASEMDIVGSLFSIKFAGDQVELYIEDDEWFHYKCSFHRSWLKDLAAVAERGSCEGEFK